MFASPAEHSGSTAGVGVEKVTSLKLREAPAGVQLATQKSGSAAVQPEAREAAQGLRNGLRPRFLAKRGNTRFSHGWASQRLNQRYIRKVTLRINFS